MEYSCCINTFLGGGLADCEHELARVSINRVFHWAGTGLEAKVSKLLLVRPFKPKVIQGIPNVDLVNLASLSH